MSPSPKGRRSVDSFSHILELRNKTIQLLDQHYTKCRYRLSILCNMGAVKNIVGCSSPVPRSDILSPHPCHQLGIKTDIPVSQKDTQRAVVVPEASHARLIADQAAMWYKVSPVGDVLFKRRGRRSKFRKYGHFWGRICSGSKNAFLRRSDRRRAQRGGDSSMQRACETLVTSASALASSLRKCGTYTPRFW